MTAALTAERQWNREWIARARDITESAAAVVTVNAIPLTFSIADGLGLGVFSYVLIKGMAGRRRECSPAVIAVALLLAVKFAWL